MADDRKLFDALGFSWDRRAIPASDPVVHGVRRACARFRQMLAEYVWDAAVLEGNPFTFVDVQTVLDGVTPGGHRLADEDQVRNLIASTKRLLKLVETGVFRLDKATFVGLNALVAKEEALEWGCFRGEGEEPHYTPEVSLGDGRRFRPTETRPGAPELNRRFSQALRAFETIQDPLERAIAFFLFGAREQFFFDGNKRTSRAMMNGILMSHGIDAISVPAARAREFNATMVGFYLGTDASPMMRFMLDCHPESAAFVAAGPDTPGP